jgi:hypothetical protein
MIAEFARSRALVHCASQAALAGARRSFAFAQGFVRPTGVFAMPVDQLRLSLNQKPCPTRLRTPPRPNRRRMRGAVFNLSQRRVQQTRVAVMPDGH